MSDEAQRRAIAKALLGDDPELFRLYNNSGTFHAGFKNLVSLLPEFVEFLARKGGEEEQRAEIIRSALDAGHTVNIGKKGALEQITEVVAQQAMHIRDQVGGRTPAAEITDETRDFPSTPAQHSEGSGHLVINGDCTDCAWPNLADDVDAPEPYTGLRVVGDTHGTDYDEYLDAQHQTHTEHVAGCPRCEEGP